MKRNADIKKRWVHFGMHSNRDAILVSISKQKLYLIKDKKTIKTYPVSTSKYGIGNKDMSYKTPLGLHRIVSKIGKNAKFCDVFKSRRRIKKIAKLNIRDIDQDLITTRILRLQGLERGINHGKGIDTYERCIYIHGTPQENLIGKPASHGCIRMKNRDIIELFNLVKIKTPVLIQN
jgi:hypothetical protein